MKLYIKKGAIFDILANIPVFIFYPQANSQSSMTELEALSEDYFFLICMCLRCLRLTRYIECSNLMHRLKDFLTEVFYLQSYMIRNIFSWVLATSKFILCVHYLACGWIGMHVFDKNRSVAGFTDESSMGVMYIESFYFMTSTISTVGYGEFSAFVKHGDDWFLQALSMFQMTLSTVCGILLFTVVTNEIFNYEKLLTVEQIVYRIVNEIHNHLLKINTVIKDRELEQEIFDSCKQNMTVAIKGSTLFYFEQNQFY